MPDEPTHFRMPPALSPEDAAIIDRLLDDLGSPQSAQTIHAAAHAADDSPRAARVSRVLSLIDAWPAAEPPADLAARTLAQIEQTRQQAQFDRQIRALALAGGPAGSFRRFAWNDLAAVAAMLIAAFSLGLPMLSSSRAQSRQIACADNLRAAGAAMGSYAADNQGQMPRLGNFEGQPWFLVGQGVDADAASGQPHRVRSNSAHLFVLVRRGYVHPGSLACPENQHAPGTLSAQAFDWPSAPAVSYSYQNQFTARPLILEHAPHMAVLADKNPLFVISRDGQTHQIRLHFRRDLPADAISEMHRGSQNMLRGDGAVSWARTPVLPDNQDNIWLLDDVGDYKGNESPARPDDAHLIP